MVNPAERVESPNVLPDGRYDVLVLDADMSDGQTEDEEQRHPEADVHLEVVVTAGEFKGEVVGLRTSGQSLLQGGIDPVELLALPGWLTVSAGVPSFLLA